MADEDNTLFVKHLPAVLALDERAELLRHFGAEHVRCMSDNGKMRYAAFATFSDTETASFALKRLHQLEILGSKLCVEFAKSGQKNCFPSLLEQPKEAKGSSGVDSEETAGAPKFEKKTDAPPLPETVNSINSKLDINHPLNPKFKYLYPPPTVTILTNIANALATVPKFYIQVLHLMNKMNLPSPFGAVTSTPPIAAEPVYTPAPNLGDDVIMEEEMVMSSTEESELESDSGDVKDRVILPVKRKKKLAAPKKPKLQKVSVPQKLASSSSVIKPQDVFEPIDNQGIKKSELNLHSGISKALDRTKSRQGLGDAKNSTGFEKIETSCDSGFGKIQPLNKRSHDDQTLERAESSGPEMVSEYISSSELRRNRLTEREMRDYNIFKDYSRGEVSSRLYIKNLHRRTTEKELKYIFGRFVDWDNDLEVSMFDVRLMTEGRMKGQAFVTLASEKEASRALKETNGYLLHNRPLVVSFARCAKAKEVAEPVDDQDTRPKVAERTDSLRTKASEIENGTSLKVDNVRTRQLESNTPASRLEQSVSLTQDSQSHDTLVSKSKIENLSEQFPVNIAPTPSSWSEESRSKTLTINSKDSLIPLGVVQNSGQSAFNQNVNTEPHCLSPENSQSIDGSATPPFVPSGAESPEIESDRFITKQMLLQNRLNNQEIQSHKLYKNYSRGEPSCKLYVKNLDHKNVTEEDLLYVFGRFVTSSDSKGLDIRLLQGRMKGQAFVTYKSVDEAKSALELVNWYKLYDKPMVVQFGKS